ncbi:MAG: FHA domain-containing protein [Planctomycetota bacterium]|jgi:hypothetical protein
MADNTLDRFYLEVLTGDDKGTTCWVNPEKPLRLGTDGSVDVVVRGAGVKAEHAVVNLVKGRVWVENLSSSGTLLSGRRIRDRAVMVADEVISLGDEIKVALRTTGQKKSEESSPLLIPLLLLIVVFGGILLAVITAKPRSSGRKARPITLRHWQKAHERIHTRLSLWVSQDRMDNLYLEGFTQAWFREQGGDKDGAKKQWRRLYNGLVTLTVPGATRPGTTVASTAELSPDTLYVLMGRDPSRNPDNSLMWKGDDAAYASAWWWFINKRIEALSKKPE